MTAIGPNELEMQNLQRLLASARQEDLADGDVTAALLPDDLHARGSFVARQPLVICGCAMLRAVAEAYDSRIETSVRVAEGASAVAGEVLAEWSGPARGVLSAERLALNFLQRLCGIASATRRYVDAVAGTRAAIYDTRKTMPGWRHLEKYAVRCGGGRNHRMGLYDAVLVKDNHLATLRGAGSDNPIATIAAGFASARAAIAPGGFIEVEVDTLEELAEALKTDLDVVLLDNMSPEQLRAAVAMRDDAGRDGSVELEASGEITLDSVCAVAATGVERIAVGAITHSVVAMDIGLDMEFDA